MSAKASYSTAWFKYVRFRVVQVDQWGKKIVPVPVESEDRHRDQSRLDQRQNDAIEYARLAASINDSRLVQFDGYAANELNHHEDEEGPAEEMRNDEREIGIDLSQLAEHVE